MLLYLNEGMKGGETSFPRWLNGESHDVLKVTPEAGKAILFYNQLPDGNYDERSQHAALPVREGEKWLTNLWIWVSRVFYLFIFFVIFLLLKYLLSLFLWLLCVILYLQYYRFLFLSLSHTQTINVFVLFCFRILPCIKRSKKKNK